MNFTKLVPNIFYKDIQTGLKTFVKCLEFTIGHSEIETANPFCVLEKDGLRINLFQNEEFAEKEHPEFRLVTENIDEVYEKVSAGFPELASQPQPYYSPALGREGICADGRADRYRHPAMVATAQLNIPPCYTAITFDRLTPMPLSAA